MSTSLASTTDDIDDLVLNSYEPEEIDAYYDGRPLLVLQRVIEVGSPLLAWYVNRKIDQTLEPYRSDEENAELRAARAKNLRDSIVKGKSVTFIKTGQALALRPDIVKSLEYVPYTVSVLLTMFPFLTMSPSVHTFSNGSDFYIASYF
jgi:ABC-type microcin C transport system permease subunit YejE